MSEGLPPELLAALLDDLGSSPPVASLGWLSVQPNPERRAIALAVQRTLVDQPWDPLGAGLDSSSEQTAALRDVLDTLVDEGGWTRDDAIAALDAVADRGKLYESASPALFFAVRVAREQPSSSFDADLRVALEGALGAVGASEKLEDVTRSIVDTALRALLPPVSVEDALLAPVDCGDPWGPRVRQALRRAGVTDAEGSLLTHLAAFKPKKPDAWINDVAPRLIEQHECARVVRDSPRDDTRNAVLDRGPDRAERHDSRRGSHPCRPGDLRLGCSRARRRRKLGTDVAPRSGDFARRCQGGDWRARAPRHRRCARLPRSPRHAVWQSKSCPQAARRRARACSESPRPDAGRGR